MATSWVGFVGPIVGKIGDILMAPVCRHFSYLFSYKSKVKNLKDEVEKLDEKRGAMQLSVDEAERNLKVIGPDVKGWLGRVDKCSEEAREILKDEVEANKGCLYGWCPNLKLRYSLGKKATNKAKEVAKLQEERKLTEVAYNKPPPGIESTSTEGIKVFESRRLIMNDVMEALKDDRFHMIAICGMGGVGKTTMVKEVAKRAKEEKLFDEVVMAVVSQSPNERKIQGEIGDKLGLEFKEETESGRADRLRERLRGTKRILVILDDVWECLELNDIGIPFGDGHRGCKILLTSRFDHICNDMNAQKKFTVEVLTKKEAWNLFEEMAGISTDTSHIDLYITQKKVADECGCLPIAIVTVARALKDKDGPSWNSALLQLRKSMAKNIRGVEEKVFKSLELSYDFLGSREIKECFLLCSLYAEDFNIPIEDLVRYGVGIELFEAIDSVNEARDRVHAFVDELKKGYLLMDGIGRCVKMHDVVRDVAISIASREEHSFMVRCDEAWKEWPEKERHKNYAVLSLQCAGMSQLPDNLEFPKLHLLRLEFSKLHLIIYNYASKLPNLPDSFYRGMKELKALSMLNVHIKASLPTSLRWLTNLRSLSLYQCGLINDVSVIGALENLEILSFDGTEINELPKEIGRLSHLKLLDLMRCGVVRICPGVLSSLSKLEELYLGSSFTYESRIEETKATLTELCGLSNFTTLVIHLLRSAYWPRDLVLTNLKAFVIIISFGREIEYFFDYQLQSHFILNDLHESDLMESGFKNLFKITKILEIARAVGVKNVGYDLDKDGFKKLTKLFLEDCQDLEYVIETTDGVPVPRIAFPVLQSLRLHRLDKLKEICHGQLPEEAFSALTELELRDLPTLTHLWKGPTQLVRLRNLTSLELARCDKLESMFSLSIARDLMQLQTLCVSECRKMEVLISNEEEGDQNEIASTTTETTDKIVFPKLKELCLGQMPKLNSFCNTSDSNYDTIQPLFSKVKLITIEELMIFGMDNVIEIWPRELQPKVRDMIIWRCPKLSNILFPSNVIKGMQSLELLSVGRCQSVEVAFNLEGIIVREGYPDIVLPSLTDLLLLYLPKLTHVCKSNLLRIPSFQNLTSVTVVGCSSLRYIFSSSQAKLLGKLREITVAECGVLEAIVNEEPKVDDEVATNIIMFPQLNSLKLYHLPSLKSLCPQAYAFEGSFIEEIKVINCPNMLELQESNVREVEFFNSSQHHLLDRKFSLSTKGILDVTGIDEPTEIWHNQLEVGCLDKVRFIRVQCCGKLSSVVSSKLMQRLHNIQGLKVWWCDSLEMIFDLQEGVCADVAEKETLITQLSKLKLKYLPKLMHIWKNISQQTHCFKNLSSLRVQHCDNLRYIFTISMANVLVNLRNLTVEHCEKVEKIVTRENEEEIFSREIDTVNLRSLPSLVCFGPDVNDNEIPARHTHVILCPKFPGNKDDEDSDFDFGFDFDDDDG
ncbi:Disease resistance protein [Camellia lanceoleosa]|uniref:Disease resistance protein n=1 Tax=Camellia lanceoleosa TaxID=1840588 RepID=A0ACC0G8E3_9ERIC|nr:Disease resistance protein [Camellia lanceoleosa]